MSAIRRWLRLTVRLIALGTLLSGCAPLASRREGVFQYSTISALLAGVYDGDLTFGQLRRQGDFGLGTVAALDGEMVALDGRFYQIKSDGKVSPVADTLRTPFAVVTFFRPDYFLSLTNAPDLRALEQWLDRVVPGRNEFVAIRIDGEFARVTTRSVPRQHHPYPPLVEAAKQQAVFEFHDVSGTLVGFRTPGFMSGLNVPGYHFHFLTADRQAGGHLLGCAVRSVRVATASSSRFRLLLPQAGGFDQADLAKERAAELNQVERRQE